MQSTDDIALLRAYTENQSDEAFAALVTKYINLVYSVAMRSVGNPSSAEEITQAVFIIFAQKAGQLRNDKAISSWLFQTTRLTANNFLRSELQRQRREQEAYDMQTILTESEPDGWPKIAPLLDVAVAVLKEKDRRAILLRFYEGKNLREIGNALGVSEAAVEKRVSRAVEKLQKFFSKRGVTSTARAITATISVNSVQIAPVALAKSVTAVALTKGATASASTLTLIKGALKIMAWTKTKMAVVVGVGVLIAAATTTVVVKKTNTFSSNDIYEEIWKHPDSDSTQALEKAPPVLLIRPTHYPNRGSGIWTTSGKGVWVNADVSDLVSFAYGFGATRMILPDGLGGEHFDYLNTLPRDRQDSTFREEIKKQFGLVAHTETRETDVMLLRVKDPAKLQTHLTKGGESSNYGMGEGNVQKRIYKNVEMAAIASLIEGNYSKPTLDQTQSSRKYDFDIQWTEKKWPSAGARKLAVQQMLADQLNQLGLELVPSREPVEMLIVEKAQ